MTERKIILHIYGSVPFPTALLAVSQAVVQYGAHDRRIMFPNGGKVILLYMRVQKKSIRVDVGYEKEMNNGQTETD